MKILKTALVILLISTFSHTFHSASAANLKSERQYYAKGIFGAVATGHPLATQAAAKVLENGGNAIDAAVCAAFVLGVTDFTNSGIGGDGYALVRTPNGAIISWDASIRKPKKYLKNTSNIGFPTELNLLLRLLKTYGSQDRANLMAPAISFAGNGFKATSYLEQLIKKKLLKLKKEKTISYLCPYGHPLLAGEIFKQPELAKTLKTIAQHGGKSFYNGKLSKEIIAHINSLGSSYSQQDFSLYRCKPEKPHSITYGKYKLIGVPPPSSSIASLAIAKLLLKSGINLFPKTLAELENIAELERKVIDVKHAKLSHFLSRPNAFIQLCESKTQVKSVFNKTDANTTHLCVWDKQGYLISMTLTLGSHCGTGDLSPLGFFYNNEMRNYQSFIAKYPNDYPTNAGPISSKSPVIILKNNKPVLAIGGAGSDRIITNIGLVIARVISGQSNLIKAIHGPRFFINYKHELVLEWFPGLRKLTKTGTSKYKTIIKTGGNDYFGLVTAIEKTGKQLEAIADFRRDGCSAAINHSKTDQLEE